MSYKHRIYRSDGTFWVDRFVDDDSRSVFEYGEDGDVVMIRAFTDEENAQLDEDVASQARLTDFEQRIARLEALLLPTPPEPTAPTDAPEWAELEPANWWGNGALLLDTDGVVYRNVSGTILTTPPSGFPGTPSAWAHLFVVALEAAEPEPELPLAAEWDKDTRYEIGDTCTRNGRTYQCRVAHGAEYQGTWGPPAGAVWTDITDAG